MGKLSTESVLTILTCSQLEHVSRVDVVWDEYFPESLKAETRSKRGKGVHRHVEPSSVIPGNWPEFLRIEDKKA
ncbi:50S ribosomal protein L25 [Dissostichus eleginoides]|uniref:50S ribosomal protein L25 n=1 Tax=Dissostichus eleginoides TaxID=100907 RepID=A0AAD9BXV6_DISEL|nr:50S ribosomal protein L25 [Dissostichus eleginoides]